MQVSAPRTNKSRATAPSVESAAADDPVLDLGRRGFASPNELCGEIAFAAIRHRRAENARGVLSIDGWVRGGGARVGWEWGKRLGGVTVVRGLVVVGWYGPWGEKCWSG